MLQFLLDVIRWLNPPDVERMLFASPALDVIKLPSLLLAPYSDFSL